MIPIRHLLLISLIAPLLGACANGGKLLSIEPDAKQGDLQAVATDLRALKRDQQGVVNAQADLHAAVTAQIGGVRDQVIHNAVPREVWWLMLAMLALSNADSVASWLPAFVGAFPCWRRGRRKARSPP